MEDAITQLIQLVRDASPILWNAAQQGVRAQAVSQTIWLLVFLFADIVYALNFSKMVKRVETNEDETTPLLFLLFGGAVVITSIIFALVATTNIINCILAPDYMAIKILTGLVIH